MNNKNAPGWAIITPVEQKEIEKRGYSLLKEDKIKCANCGKALVEVIKVKEEGTETAIRASCPYCKDSSFWYKIQGKIYIQAVDGLSINDAPVAVMNGIRFTRLEVIKNG